MGRQWYRLAWFISRCAGAGLDRPNSAALRRAEWSNRHAIKMVRAIGMKVEVEGDPGDANAWVGNHLGYLDVVGLATVRPVSFVAKAEVEKWPVLGGLAARSGTIFLERERRMAVAAATESMSSRVEQGVPVVFFPEGTSSAGESVLPFHAPLFGPAVAQSWKVVPFALRYEVTGPAGTQAEYWGEMSFGPHFLSLLRHRTLRMRIRFGSPVRLEGDRKAIAREWHAKVGTLLEGLRGGMVGRAFA
jgi:1-acyl-sn-glycerol-3-phosphate acyltransferase